MEFVTERKNKKEFGSVSKSRLAKYMKCPAQAYESLRETKKDLSFNQAIEKGNLYHELAAKQLHDMCTNKDYVYDIKKLETYTDLGIYNEVLDSMKFINLSKKLDGQAIIEIEKEITIQLPEVAPDFIVRAKPDGLSYMTIDKQDYIGIIEFKSGFSDISVIDNEVIIYAYAISKKYSLPVVFQRINLTNGKMFTHVFNKYRLAELKPQIVYVIKKWKSDMESEIKPEIKPGSHCSYCPYLTKCAGRKHISTLRQKYKAAIIAKNLAKKYEEEVKDAAKAELEMHPEYTESKGENILLPFLDNRYGAISKTTEFNQLAKKIVKKDEVKDLIIEYVLSNPTPENQELLKNCMSISLTDEVANILENNTLAETIQNTENVGIKESFKGDNYIIPVKRSIRTTISIKEKISGDDEDEE